MSHPLKTTPPTPEDIVEELLDSVETGATEQTVTLRSGRRVELESGAASPVDRIVVRSPSGRVLLRVAVGEHGPLLSFESAEIALSARRKLAVSAPEVNIAAERLSTTAGERVEHVSGSRHTRIAGDERLEAAAVDIQASDASVRVRAMDHVAIDADHIGLNDMPCPEPFDWSALEAK
jgi:hypothetical protein